MAAPSPTLPLSVHSTTRHFQRAGQLVPAWSSASPLTEETDELGACEASFGNGTGGAVLAEVSVGPGRRDSNEMCCV